MSGFSSLSHNFLGDGQDAMENTDTLVMIDQQDSPDRISLAFPPLPLAFQPHCVSTSQTRLPSPVPSHRQMNSSYGHQTESGFDSTYPDSNTVAYATGSGFEDPNFFFEYSFPPNQRISRFSGPAGKDGDQQK
jgi:hypothetical protein